jgi:hypothetical protein
MKVFFSKRLGFYFSKLLDVVDALADMSGFYSLMNLLKDDERGQSVRGVAEHRGSRS